MSELADTLVSYVSDLGLRRLAVAGDAPLQSCATRFPAAALFADISGSTALAERLAERGPAGAEELSRALNTYFGELIEIIAAHGGNVAQFAGDGLLALWPVNSTDDDLTLLTRRAAQCGTVAQSKLHNFPAGEGIRLSMRIGIGAGEAAVSQVGGVSDLWKLLIAGAAVAQACAAEAEALPGRVVVSPEAWALVRRALSGQRLATGTVRIVSIIESPPNKPLGAPHGHEGAEKYLRAFAPRAILARLDARQSDWLAELRRVTALFINLPELDCIADLDRTHQAIRAIQSALNRYSGSVLRFGTDRKGPTVLSGFGLPALAHENDEQRAVRAALAIHATLRDMGLNSAIGIATGRAFCGSVGNSRRREYTMVADVVNVAARLMQHAAPDDILCDESTYQACRSDIRFETLPERTVHGKSDPLPSFRPCGEGPRVQRPQTTLVGRPVERGLLAEQLHSLSRDSVGHTVLIEGEAGIGKSRLVEELREQAERRGVPCLLGAGDAVETSTPYHAWRAIFTHLLGLDGAPVDDEARRAGVRAAVDAARADGEAPSSAELAPLLNAVVALDLEDNALTAQMTGQARADNTHELLLRLLRSATRTAPLLLILEDAHWLDSASWALTRLVSQRVPGVLLVLASRPIADPPPAEYRQLLHAPGTYWLWLPTLPEKDIVTLVCQRLGVASLPDAVAAFITEKAGGHPFFSEELAYSLRSSGRIVVVNGECRLGPGSGDLHALGFPDTVEGVVTSRIDRLTPRQHLLLKVASVIGRDFALRTLHDAHPIEDDKPFLSADLNALVQLDLVHLAVPGPQLTYRFKHIITQEVAYNLMSFAQRRQLHRAVGDWYERTSGEDLSPLYALLAHHWSQAAQADATVTPKAITYLEAAAEQALGSYANREAARFLTEALTLEETASRGGAAHHRNGAGLRRARWERQAGEAYYRLGNAAEARNHLQRALRMLGYRVPSRRVSVLISLVGQVGRQALHRVAPAKFVRHAGTDRRAKLLEGARAHETLALVSFIASETLASINGNLRGLNLAEAAGASPELANSYAMVGLLSGLIAQPRLAERYFQFALGTAEGVNDRGCLGRVWFTKGYYLVGKAEWAAAQDALSRAYKTFEQLGDRRWCETTLLTLGNMNYNQGQYTHSLELYGAAYESGHRRGDVQAQAWAMVAKALVQLTLGRADVALDTMTTLESWLANSFEPLSDRTAEINAYGIRALAHCRRDERDLALQPLEKAVGLIAQSTPAAYYGLTGYAAAAEVALTLWESSNGEPAERDKLVRLSQQACTGLRTFAGMFPIGQPQAWLWEGLRDWLSDKPSKAHAAWEKSLTLAERLQMPYEEGLAHLEIGRHAPPNAAQRRSHLVRAGEIFSQLDARHHQARVQIALDAAAPASR